MSRGETSTAEARTIFGCGAASVTAEADNHRARATTAQKAVRAVVPAEAEERYEALVIGVVEEQTMYLCVALERLRLSVCLSASLWQVRDVMLLPRARGSAKYVPGRLGTASVVDTFFSVLLSLTNDHSSQLASATGGAPTSLFLVFMLQAGVVTRRTRSR